DIAPSRLLRMARSCGRTAAKALKNLLLRSALLQQEISSIWRWSESITEQMQTVKVEVAKLQAMRGRLERSIEGMKTDLQFQRRRLIRISENRRGATPEEAELVADDEAIKSLYLQFEERFRGSREEIKNRLRVHLA